MVDGVVMNMVLDCPKVTVGRDGGGVGGADGNG